MNFIDELVVYAIGTRLIREADAVYTRNRLLELLGMSEPLSGNTTGAPLCHILKAFCDYAVDRGIIEDSITDRDLFDTSVMGCITPRPSEVLLEFKEHYAISPKEATDYFYGLSKATNYIRTDRIARDERWTTSTIYGDIEISINLSKPEKDPKAIAAAKNAAPSSYPKCLLCRETEGYSGSRTFPARQNHRLIPITLQNRQWFLQYSPYVYYNEHCIVLDNEHTPMKIDGQTIDLLFDFIDLFPHYFIGSNADLPIVGGSILSHNHFQGGCHEFPMARAGIKASFQVKGFDDVLCGILDWPVSVIRLESHDRARVSELGNRIIDLWRKYTDESADIFAFTEGQPHNTVTPIARKKTDMYQLDLALRNNITTPEHPLGLFHPHEELHHIKKENIGLIEVMGLAILPARLKHEISALLECRRKGGDPASVPELEKHAAWARGFDMTQLSEDYIKHETGLVFQKVLEDAGVFKCDRKGIDSFMRFTKQI